MINCSFRSQVIVLFTQEYTQQKRCGDITQIIFSKICGYLLPSTSPLRVDLIQQNIMYLPTEGKAPSKKKLTDAAKHWSRQSHVFFEAKTSIRFAVSMEESIVNTKSSQKIGIVNAENPLLNWDRRNCISNRDREESIL